MEVIMIGFKSIIAVLLLLAINIGCGSSQQFLMLKSGVDNWNKWRKENTSIKPDLYGVWLMGADLQGANLAGADLTGAALQGANLERAQLEGADLKNAYLQGADLDSANLQVAHFYGAVLRGADLTGANLGGADLRGTGLWGADLGGANLELANLSGAKLEGADLSKVQSFYRAKLDPDILSEIKANWPEKLATFWHATKKDWVIDTALLEQIKKHDWNGW